MEYLTNYESDDSETEVSEDELGNIKNSDWVENGVKNASHYAFQPPEQNLDYFHLNESDSDDDVNKIQQNIEMQAAILSEKIYGPSLLQDQSNALFCTLSPHTSDVDKAQLMLRAERSVQNFQPQNATNKMLKREMYYVKENAVADEAYFPMEKRQKYDLSADTETEITVKDSTCSEAGNIHQKEKKPVFEINSKITYYISKHLSSYLPKKKIKILNGHKSSVSTVNWCVPHFSHLLLSGSLDTSLKIWDTFSGKCVQEINADSGLQAARWTLCGTKVIYGGYEKKLHMVDIAHGQQLLVFDLQNYLNSIEVHPLLQSVFLTGTKNEILAWDTRKDPLNPIRSFATSGQVLDISFIQDGKEVVCSTDTVSHDSADKTIMAWDFSSGALISNQIFNERYTCPCIETEPDNNSFVAQTNGNYIAIFSTERPYKMNKNKRYEGHKVAGYPIGCSFSPDGKYLASGDAEGGFYIYWTRSTQLAAKLIVSEGIPTVQTKWHPVMSSTVATATWDGQIQIWQ